jgi:thioredoxin 1
MAKHPIKLTDNSFKRATRSGVALIDFWAPWCRPCRMVGPIVEEIAGELGDRVLVGKLNVDENPKTASQFRVQSIPTVLVLKDGELHQAIVGARRKGDYVGALQQLLA